MPIARIYADTSVYGGVFDEEFAVASREFFDAVRRGRFLLVTSVIVRDELLLSPSHVQDYFQDLAPIAEILRINPEAIQLQEDYLRAEVVTSKSQADALHVALATVAACPIIVSWNFKHIVHFQKIPQYNAINRLRGYDPIAIHSPEEVRNNEDEDL